MGRRRVSRGPGRAEASPSSVARVRAELQRQASLPVLVLLVALALALPAMVYIWSSEAIFSLGFLVAPWALWRVLRTQRQEPAATGWRALALAGSLGLALVGWTLGMAWAAAWAVALALILVGLERGQATTSLLPAGLLALTVPPPAFDRWLVAIQQAVAWSSGKLLALIGTPVTRTALTLETPTYSFQVAPVCTGLSGLLATVALVGMVAHHTQAPRRRLGWALAAGIAAAVALNLLRIMAVVVTAERWGPTLADGAFHGAVSMVLSLVAFGVSLPLLRARDDEMGLAQRVEGGDAA